MSTRFRATHTSACCTSTPKPSSRTAAHRENQRLGPDVPEIELMDTGAFDEGRYFDVEIEIAKASPEEIVLPGDRAQPELRGSTAPHHPAAVVQKRLGLGRGTSRFSP
jgi:hypothetical protein